MEEKDETDIAENWEEADAEASIDRRYRGLIPSSVLSVMLVFSSELSRIAHAHDSDKRTSLCI